MPLVSLCCLLWLLKVHFLCCHSLRSSPGTLYCRGQRNQKVKMYTQRRRNMGVIRAKYPCSIYCRDFTWPNPHSPNNNLVLNTNWKYVLKILLKSKTLIESSEELESPERAWCLFCIYYALHLTTDITIVIDVKRQSRDFLSDRQASLCLLAAVTLSSQALFIWGSAPVGVINCRIYW